MRCDLLPFLRKRQYSAFPIIIMFYHKLRKNGFEKLLATSTFRQHALVPSATILCCDWLVCDTWYRYCAVIGTSSATIRTVTLSSRVNPIIVLYRAKCHSHFIMGVSGSRHKIVNFGLILILFSTKLTIVDMPISIPKLFRRIMIPSTFNKYSFYDREAAFVWGMVYLTK